MASSRLDRLAKVRPDLLDLRPGHLVRAVRRPVAALVVSLRVVRLQASPAVPLRVVRRQVSPAVRLRPEVPLVHLLQAVPAARVVRLRPVARAVRVVLAARRSTAPATRSAVRPARASCR